MPVRPYPKRDHRALGCGGDEWRACVDLRSCRVPRPLAGERRAPFFEMATAAQAATSGLFECNICLDTASEPVLTHCGHLYCWPCLYRWMQSRRSQALCPICKVRAEREPRESELTLREQGRERLG